MKNLKIVTHKYVEVELNENDMSIIHHHYEEQCTADYLRDNHEDWSEEKVQAIAKETRRQMDNYGYSEEEAIHCAMLSYEKENGKG